MVYILYTRAACGYGVALCVSIYVIAWLCALLYMFPYVWPYDYIIRAWPHSAQIAHIPHTSLYFTYMGNFPMQPILRAHAYLRSMVQVYVCRMQFGVAIYIECSNLLTHVGHGYIIHRISPFILYIYIRTQRVAVE